MRRRLEALGPCAVALAVVCLSFAWPLQRIGVRVPIDRNEGWNAQLAARSAAGEALYFGASELVVDNYPPLSFVVVGALGKRLAQPDLILVGRVVSLCALLGCALLVAHCTRRTGGSWAAATFAGAFLLADVAAHHDGYVAMNDPQWLGHALQLVGLALLSRGFGMGTIAALSCFGLGLLVKHTLIALPLTAAWWLARSLRPPQRGKGVLALAGAAVAVTAAVVLACGPHFWSNLLLPRTYSASDAARSALKQALYLSPVAWLAFRPLRARASIDAWSQLLCAYFGLGLVLGAIALGGAGVDTNAMFDAVIAAALCAGHAYDRAAGWARAAMLVVIVAATPLRLQHQAEARADSPHAAARAQAVVDLLRTLPSPVLCEELAYCHWARQPLVYDAFSTRQRMAAGTLDRRALARRIASGELSALQISVQALDPGERAAAARSYRASALPGVWLRAP